MATETYLTRLAEIIDREGRKQSWLARATGIDPAELSRYCKGLHCPDRHRGPIAEALGREIPDVFPEAG